MLFTKKINQSSIIKALEANLGRPARFLVLNFFITIIPLCLQLDNKQAMIICVQYALSKKNEHEQ